MARDLAIAVIDDDESFRDALVESLSSMGHRVRGYASARKFIAVDKGSSDCVVTDIHMPGMSGLDLIRHLVAHGFSAPVVLITARPDAGLANEALASGAAFILRKPFKTADLVECLEKALGA